MESESERRSFSESESGFGIKKLTPQGPSYECKKILNRKKKIYFIFKGFNGPLQGRTKVLNLDLNLNNIEPMNDCKICKQIFFFVFQKNKFV